MRFMPDEVSMPFEGEMEDFDKPEEPQANDDPIPIENDNHKATITPGIDKTANEAPQQPAQPAVAVDGDNGHGKRIRKESAYVHRIWEGENTTTLPWGLQTVPEKAVEEERAGGAWEAEEEDWARSKYRTMRIFLSRSLSIPSSVNQSSMRSKKRPNSSGFPVSNVGAFFSPGFGIFLVGIGTERSLRLLLPLVPAWALVAAMGLSG